MKKLISFFIIFTLFFAFSKPVFASENFEYQISYSSSSNTVAFKIYHASLFSNQKNFSVTGKQNGLTVNFSKKISGKFMTVSFKNLNKGEENKFSITFLDKNKKALGTINDTIYINEFNKNAMYFFFKPSYDPIKQQFSFNIYTKRKNLAKKIPVKVKVNGELATNLSFVSQKKVASTDLVIQKYVLPLESGEKTIDIFSASEKESYVNIALLKINPISYSDSDASNDNVENFPDVSKAFWAYNSIKWARDIGYSVGGEFGNFYPKQNITRAEAATIISRLMNADSTSSAKAHKFSDIKNHWAANNISFLSSEKIVAGYKNGKFLPNKSITRAEASAMLSNYLIYNDLPFVYKQNAKKFSDVSGSAWYSRSIDSLSNMKIVAGYLNKKFEPNNLITRAEFITIIKNLNDDIYINAIY